MRAAKTLSQLKRESGGRARSYRPSAAKRGYGYRWQKASKGFLKKNPLCVECKEQGSTTQAEVVDHIVPHKGDMKLFWDRDNWQSMCVPCHNSKTAREDGGFGRLDGGGGVKSL